MIVTFCDIVIAKANDGVSFKQGKTGEFCTFIGIEKDGQELMSHQFIAFGNTVEVVRKMKLRAGSRIHITAKGHKYLSGQRKEYNFEVMDIKFADAAFLKHDDRKEFPPNPTEEGFGNFKEGGEK